MFVYWGVVQVRMYSCLPQLGCQFLSFSLPTLPPRAVSDFRKYGIQNAF